MLHNMLRAAAGNVPRDPFFSYVSTLLKFEESTPSTTINDTGPIGFNYAVNGGDVTATSLYGIGSWLMDASGEYATTPVRSEFTLDGPFTIEFSSLYPSGATASSGNDIIMGCHNDGNATDGWFVELGRNRGFFVAQKGAGFITYSGHNPNDGVKHDYCIERNSSDLVRLYIDGVSVKSLTNSAALSGAIHGFRIGSNTVHWPVATLDEVRITKGVARYDAASYTLGQPF